MIPKYWDSLAKEASELEQVFVEDISGSCVTYNCTKPPFNDVNVRRAMMIGTYVQAFNAIWAPEAKRIN